MQFNSYCFVGFGVIIVNIPLTDVVEFAWLPDGVSDIKTKRYYWLPSESD
jgi:hypothetical protein